MVTMVSSSQPKVPDYDPEIQAWPASLPPPLVGEVEIDRNLVMRIRDGRMTLDNEDALVTECIKVWVAHTRDGERVWWIPPKEDTETWQNQDYQKGYELMFINEGAPDGAACRHPAYR